MNIIYQTSRINTPSIQSSATALAANSDRRGWAIQNLGQNALYVLKGTGASTTVFHRVLKAGTANDDGTGGSVNESIGAVYTGPITIAGTTPRYTVEEM